MEAVKIPSKVAQKMWKELLLFPDFCSIRINNEKFIKFSLMSLEIEDLFDAWRTTQQCILSSQFFLFLG